MGYFARLKQKPPEVQSRHALVWTSIIFIGVLVLWFTNMSAPDITELAPKDPTLQNKLEGVTSTALDGWNGNIEK